MRNMSHLNLLYTITQTVNHGERINALTEVYRFLQEFQPWKESACLYASIQRKIRRLLDDEIPVEIERVSTNQKTDGILFDLFELEHTVIVMNIIDHRAWYNIQQFLIKSWIYHSQSRSSILDLMTACGEVKPWALESRNICDIKQPEVLLDTSK
jgi:hypothetical protein